MKKLIAIVAIVTLAVLTSCTKQDKEVITDTLTQDTQVNTEVESEPEIEVDSNEEESTQETSTPQESEDVTDGLEENTQNSDDILEVEVETETETPTALAGTYVEYDSSLVGSTDNTVLFFHAIWCSTCKAADAEISSNSIPDDLTVLKVDYDSAGELRQKYGVTTQHTFVQVDADGNEIAKWLGSRNMADIEAKLQ